MIQEEGLMLLNDLLENVLLMVIASRGMAEIVTLAGSAESMIEIVDPSSSNSKGGL